MHPDSSQYYYYSDSGFVIGYSDTQNYTQESLIHVFSMDSNKNGRDFFMLGHQEKGFHRYRYHHGVADVGKLSSSICRQRHTDVNTSRVRIVLRLEVDVYIIYGQNVLRENNQHQLVPNDI